MTKHTHTVLHSGRTNLHSHQQCRRVPFSPYPLHHCCRFFVDGHSDQCERDNTTVVFICFSLIISGVEQLFTCLLAICMSVGEVSI